MPELFNLHGLFSLLALACIGLASLQSIVLAVQHSLLRSKRYLALAQAFPPVETMEKSLFFVLWIGFIILSLALASGFIFMLQGFPASYLIEKSALACLAWVVFALLLWGRHYFGWRGKTAVKWTLCGMLCLSLVYSVGLGI